MQAMFNKAWFSQALHMSIAAFAATGFAVAGIHALMILRKNNIRFHYKAFKIAASFGIVASILQPLSGDISAKDIAKRQPAKLAAMEAHFETQKNAPLIVGGIPDEKNNKVGLAIKIPGLLSYMAHGNFEAEVMGLDQIKKIDRPPVAITHYAFQIMVGLGMAMMAAGLLYLFALIKKHSWFEKKWFLKLFVAATPIGFIAVEAGWIVTEVGRQPWIIYKIMRTADAVTPMPGIQYSFYLFTLVYFTLSLAVGFLLYRQIKMVPVIYDKPIHIVK